MNNVHVGLDIKNTVMSYYMPRSLAECMMPCSRTDIFIGFNLIVGGYFIYIYITLPDKDAWLRDVMHKVFMIWLMVRDTRRNELRA